MRSTQTGRNISVVATLLIVLVALIVTPPVESSTASAPGGTWSDIGPEGARIVALAVDPTNPSVVYTGTGAHRTGYEIGHLFKSQNGGQTWTLSSIGLLTDSQRWMGAIWVAHGVPNLLFAITGGQLYRSIDAAASWTAVNWQYSGSPVYLAAIDPTTPSVLYGIAGSALVKTTDGGMT
jgi:photosystem II stability/assembly factor-like uncharacterized protein